MKDYKAGEKVGYGLYVSPKALDVRFVGSDDETLAGKRGSAYYRLPALLMIAAAPVLGGIFVMAFPLMVLLMVAGAILRLVYNTVSSAVEARTHLLQMNWQPSAAYLNKDKSERKEGENTTEKTNELKDLNQEVQKRRNEES
ncbi:MAG: hypothetical protein A2X94_04220 [Bdellovibrionales bacterium GWB1_55_8]|nr:MAG: hypothetical protein A2X94_04220 [Bdellovibrionales bacterium GWB1_55_8]